MNNGSAIADAGAVVLANTAGVILNLANSERIGSLAGGGGTGGNVTLSTNTLTTGDATNTAFAGVISGSGSGTHLIKVGAGNFTLSGTNTFTGLTRIDTGKLILGANDVLHDSSSLNVNGGTLDVDVNADTVALVTLTDGSIIGSGALTSTAAFELKKGSVSAELGGSAGANKTTADSVTLSGANTYTGLTLVSAGTFGVRCERCPGQRCGDGGWSDDHPRPRSGPLRQRRHGHTFRRRQHYRYRNVNPDQHRHLRCSQGFGQCDSGWRRWPHEDDRRHGDPQRRQHLHRCDGRQRW